MIHDRPPIINKNDNVLNEKQCCYVTGVTASVLALALHVAAPNLPVAVYGAPNI